MRLTDLETFLLVAQENSASRAAELLYATHQTVSQRIKTVERELGERLFDRCARGMELSQTGKLFVPYAHACLFVFGQGMAVVHKQAIAEGKRQPTPAEIAAAMTPWKCKCAHPTAIAHHRDEVKRHVNSLPEWVVLLAVEHRGELPDFGTPW